MTDFPPLRFAAISETGLSMHEIQHREEKKKKESTYYELTLQAKKNTHANTSAHQGVAASCMQCMQLLCRACEHLSLTLTHPAADLLQVLKFQTWEIKDKLNKIKAVLSYQSLTKAKRAKHSDTLVLVLAGMASFNSFKGKC